MSSVAVMISLRKIICEAEISNANLAVVNDPEKDIWCGCRFKMRELRMNDLLYVMLGHSKSSTVLIEISTYFLHA